MTEYKIGETFDYNGIKLMVTTNSNGDCNGCYFDKNRECVINDSMGDCLKFFREDRQDVIFKQVK